jgi:hypothetical protein
MVPLNLYDFTKNHILIKDGIDTRHFNDHELNQIKEVQTMMDTGYELKCVKTRKGTSFIWVKSNIENQ